MIGFSSVKKARVSFVEGAGYDGRKIERFRCFMEISEQLSISCDLNFLKLTIVRFSQSFYGLFNSLIGALIVRKIEVNEQERRNVVLSSSFRLDPSFQLLHHFVGQLSQFFVGYLSQQW